MKGRCWRKTGARMNWFVHPARYLIDYRNNERQFRRHEEPIAVHSLTFEKRTINAIAPFFFFLLQISLVNEREMDVWIETNMAPFLLILPLLASLIHPIGKWGSSSMFRSAGKCNDVGIKSETLRREIRISLAFSDALWKLHVWLTRVDN